MTNAVTYLSYPDSVGALEWLKALGFEVVTQHLSPTGTVVHAELRLDDAVVMIAHDDQDYVVPPLLGQSTGVGLYLVTDDVDGLYAAALQAGGSAVFGPEDTEWGSRRARVLDPAGREWSFGSYAPGT